MSGPARDRRPSAAGFTLLELMLVVVLIGIVAGVTVNLVPAVLRRERLNAVVMELEGWLQELAQVPERQGISCRVTISTGSLAAGATLASVSPSSCSSQPTLRVPVGVEPGPLLVQASPTAWSFTPRGAVDLTSALQIRMTLQGQLPQRCLQVGATLGLIRLGGSETSTDLSLHCPVPASL